MNKRLKLMIGIPISSAYLHRKFVQSLMSLKFLPNIDVDINVIEGYQLPFARNRIVENALQKNVDFLLFIDADMIFPSDLFTKLYSHNLPIINSLAFRRIQPHYPCIFNWNINTNCYETVSYTNGLKEVDATGMAGILINTEVFKNLPKPWFYYDQHQFSSDLTFCKNAKQAGYKIMIDTDLKLGHIGEEVIITEEYYISHLSEDAKKQWNDNILKDLRAKDKEII